MLRKPINQWWTSFDAKKNLFLYWKAKYTKKEKFQPIISHPRKNWVQNEQWSSREIECRQEHKNLSNYIKIKSVLLLLDIYDFARGAVITRPEEDGAFKAISWTYKNKAFKNCTPFKKYIIETNNTQIIIAEIWIFK